MKQINGLWKFSPSMLYGYTDCKSCFWMENHIGRHPFTLPLKLNQAMDTKMKNRYDSFRKHDSVPPELNDLEGYTLYSDFKKLDQWRESWTALKVDNNKDGWTISGKLDEVLVNSAGKLVIADYKSSGDAPGPYKYKYYENQLNAYAYMLRAQGEDVAEEGFLLHYFPLNNEDPTINVKLSFHADKVKLDLNKFEKHLKEIVDFLNGPYPGKNSNCKKCDWVEKTKSIQ